jgi:hypothetical protein
MCMFLVLCCVVLCFVCVLLFVCVSLRTFDAVELYTYAKEISAPYDLLKKTQELGRLPVVQFAAGGVATPADGISATEDTTPHHTRGKQRGGVRSCTPDCRCA